MTVAVQEQAVRQVAAVSVDADLVARLPEDGRRGEVHSVHEHVINLRTPDGLLCCLASAVLDDAPRTIRVDAAAWPALRWHRGDTVRFGPGPVLRPEPAGVDVVLAGAERRQPPTTDLSALGPDRLRAAAAVIAGLLPTPAERSPFEAAAAEVLGRRTAGLAAAIRHHDPAAVTTAVSAAAAALVGLGAGLTPSGDDVLTGLAVVAAADEGRLGAVRDGIARALTAGTPLEERTTAVGAAMLAEAAAGRARWRIHDLLTTIATTAPGGPDLRAAVLAVRAIGHTSGTDVLEGVRLGLLAAADLTPDLKEYR
ncbi:DUF2877 domain-containing protein [Pimelobacter sp. 30-1]|uniref:oxamate carbamoyltransferase subunit AllH family protein n=1 Tax=Pimelobacter sp. 30-1 TaxID=2004991 RepID=UPI001C04D35B|nr:DUF2877 domain-containing protein [Pimelobacter sp. 30-1]MBU2693499.1 hypothetical protein [Pimelobacter sp. 30-1]